MILKRIKLLAPISAVCGSILNSGCTQDQVLRMTYETLRQEDCHRTSVTTDYCDRSYALEYVEYKQLRESYLSEINNVPITLSSNDNSLFRD